MTETLIFDNNSNLVGVINDTDNDLENNITRLIISNSNLELKYPNISNELRLMKKNQLKTIQIRIKEKNVNNLSLNKNKLCETLLGFYPNIGFDPKLNQYKIIIQGFPPNGALSRQIYLNIGDLLLKINNINIDVNNFDRILTSITKEQKLKLVFVSPLTNDILFETSYHKQLSLRPPIKVVAPSKSVSVIKGDRVKVADNQLNEDVFFMIMILSLNKKLIKNDDGNNKNDLVYMYPNYEKDDLANSNDLTNLIVTIRGLFMTLAVAIKEIDKNDQAVCCMIEHKQQIFNICFLSGKSYGQNGLLVFLVPSEHIDLNYFKIISQNLNDLFQFTFGKQIENLLLSNNENEINYEQIKLKMNCFFSQLKNPLNMSSIFNLFLNSSNTKKQSQQQKQYLASKMTNQSRIYIYNEMKSKFINQIPYIELPYDLKTYLDMSLGAVEAQEMNDLDTNYFKNRRQLFILGSCMFYRNYLIISHLNDCITKNIYNYVNHYGLLTIYGSVNQFHIWKEINLNIQSNSRHYLVITGLNELIFCMILESGGFNSRQTEKNLIIEPNPFYIQQSTILLNDLFHNGIMTEINRAFKFGSRQIIHNINKFFKDHKRSDQQQERVSKSQRQKSKSPFRLSLSKQKTKETKAEKSKKVELNENTVTQRLPSSSPTRSKTLIHNKESLNSSENEYEDEKNNDDLLEDELLHNDNMYHSNRNDKHKISMLRNKDMCSDKNKIKNPDTMVRFFNDVSLNDSVIFYATSEMSTNSILFTPKQYYLDSNLFTRVFYNFSQTCFKIKQLLDDMTNIKLIRDAKTTSQDSINLVEQGCLFSIIVDEASFKDTSMTAKNATDTPPPSIMNNKKEKFKEITFWVVGRRKFIINNVDFSLKNLGDFYVCFHDSVDQVLLELVFDIGFGKHSF